MDSAPSLFEKLQADLIEGLTAACGAESRQYETFKARYAYDPAGFVLDCIAFPDDKTPYPYQLEILESFIGQRWSSRLAIRGPRGMGKTAMGAWLVLWGILTSDDVKVITTASNYNQLKKYLWPEIHRWAKRLRWDVIGLPGFGNNQLLMQGINLSATQMAFAVTAIEKKAETIEGAHAGRILYIYDEAKIIPDSIWDASEGAYSNAGEHTGFEAYALAISTPGLANGRFFDIHTKPETYTDWQRRHVTKEEMIAAGVMGEQWAVDKERQWGSNDQRTLNHIYGEFASENPDALLPWSWINEAVRRCEEWLDAGGPNQEGEYLERIGADIGYGGANDEPTIAPIYAGMKCPGLIVLPPNPDPRLIIGDMEDEIALMCSQAGRVVESIIDTIGLGAGLYSALLRRGYYPRAFEAGKTTDLMDKDGRAHFKRWRDAMWWLFREILDPDSGFNVMIPPDDLLIEELKAVQWWEDERPDRYLICIEKKDTLRKRLGRSTDRADALIQGMIGWVLCDWEDQQGKTRIVYDRPRIGRDYGGR